MIVAVPLKSFLAMVDLDRYHWQELSQASFLLQQKYACQDKSFVAKKIMFVFCRSKSFVTTSILCCDKSMLVETKKFCHDKHTFVCCDKSMLVKTKLL